MSKLGLGLLTAGAVWAVSRLRQTGSTGTPSTTPGTPSRVQTREAPASTVTVTGYGGTRIELETATSAAYQRLVAQARLEGFKAPLLEVVSGYRSDAHQADLFAAAVKKYGEAAARKYVAPPGNSAHRTGRAVDLWLGFNPDSSQIAAMRTTAVWKWLVAHAAPHGFAPYDVEPWHWEYSG